MRCWQRVTGNSNQVVAAAITATPAAGPWPLPPLALLLAPPPAPSPPTSPSPLLAPSPIPHLTSPLPLVPPQPRTPPFPDQTPVAIYGVTPGVVIVHIAIIFSQKLPRKNAALLPVTRARPSPRGPAAPCPLGAPPPRPRPRKTPVSPAPTGSARPRASPVATADTSRGCHVNYRSPPLSLCYNIPYRQPCTSCNITS